MAVSAIGRARRPAIAALPPLAASGTIAALPVPSVSFPCASRIHPEREAPFRNFKMPRSRLCPAPNESSHFCIGTNPPMVRRRSTVAAGTSHDQRPSLAIGHSKASLKAMPLTRPGGSRKVMVNLEGKETSGGFSNRPDSVDTGQIGSETVTGVALGMTTNWCAAQAPCSAGTTSQAVLVGRATAIVAGLQQLRTTDAGGPIRSEEHT